METYVEQLVHQKVSVQKKACLLLAEIVAVVSFAGALCFNTKLLIVTAVFGIITYILLQEADLEYEYLFVDKQLTVDKIIAKSRRKQAGIYDIAHMELFAPAGSDRMRAYENRDMKVLDYSSREPDGVTYAMIYNNEGQLMKILLEGSDELYTCFYNSSPRQVFKD